jgi:hypothetical protein
MRLGGVGETLGEGRVGEGRDVYDGRFLVGIHFIALDHQGFSHPTYRTGNILVKIATESPALEQLVILDWELSKLGTSSADVGQFAAESLLLARYATSHEPGRTLLGSFMDAYESTLASTTQVQSADDDGKALATLFDATAIVSCTAAHAAVWGMVGPWSVDDGLKERTVKGALKLCAASARGEFGGSKAKDLTKIWDGPNEE